MQPKENKWLAVVQPLPPPAINPSLEPLVLATVGRMPAAFRAEHRILAVAKRTAALVAQGQSIPWHWTVHSSRSPDAGGRPRFA